VLDKKVAKAQAALAGVTHARGALLVIDPVADRKGTSDDDKRAAISALVTITIDAPGGGRYLRPELVDIEDR
jgi:hypothetical protein